MRAVRALDRRGGAKGRVDGDARRRRDFEHPARQGAAARRRLGRLAAAVFADYRERRDAERALLSERDELLAKLLELQRTHAPAGEKFYPDANGCLRLSAGHVEGYAAADAGCTRR